MTQVHTVITAIVIILIILITVTVDILIHLILIQRLLLLVNMLSRDIDLHSNSNPLLELPSQKEAPSAKAPRARRNSTEGRITWKLSDLALQKLTTEVFPRVAEGETAPVSNVRTLFEQAGIPAGIMTST